MGNAFFITIFFGLFILVTAYDQKYCVNPLGYRGLCVDVNQCQRIHIEKQRFDRNTANRFFQTSVCGSQNNIVKVCCPHAWMNSINPISRSVPRISYGPLQYPHCGTSSKSVTRVVGGTFARLGAWPWMVALGYPVRGYPDRANWRCDGSLISTRHVLTAGHCMNLNGNERPYVVRLGDLDLNENIQDGATPTNVNIQNFVIHPNFNTRTLQNDIAVIRLVRDVTFTKLIKPLCLPAPQNGFRVDRVGTQASLAGWGQIYKDGPSSSHLRNVRVPVQNPLMCKREYLSPIFEDNIICAGSLSPGTDACHGDSGGPLMALQNGAWYSIGVVSFGKSCALGVPTVYTKTSAYLNWIVSKLY